MTERAYKMEAVKGKASACEAVQAEPKTNAKRKPGKLSVKGQHQLIISHRPVARRLARTLLRRWNANMPSEEIDSLADLALVEAAAGYKPSKKASFTTYLFYFVKGSLVRAIHSQVQNSALSLTPDLTHEEMGENEESRTARMIDQDEEFAQSPEREAYLKELRLKCNEALLGLSSLERDIVIRVQVLDYKVASVARSIGYSRGHVSNMRRDALNKLKLRLSDMRDAA